MSKRLGPEVFVEWGKIAPTKTMRAPTEVRNRFIAIVVPAKTSSNYQFYNDFGIEDFPEWKTFSSKKESFWRKPEHQTRDGSRIYIVGA
jgi:hypothetical protein